MNSSVKNQSVAGKAKNFLKRAVSMDPNVTKSPFYLQMADKDEEVDLNDEEKEIPLYDIALRNRAEDPKSSINIPSSTHGQNHGHDLSTPSSSVFLLQSKYDETSSKDIETGESKKSNVSGSSSKGKKKKKTFRLQSPIGFVIICWKRSKETTWNFYRSTLLPLLIPTSFLPYYQHIDNFFQCTALGSSIETEVFAGIIDFFACLYVLPVISAQMEEAGYNRQSSCAVISLITGLFSIFNGFLTNIPLIIAPATAVCIYFLSNIQQYFISIHNANMIVMYSGVIIVILGVIGPISKLISKLIPEYIQLATTVGIGLITTLSGYTDIDLVVTGQYTLLTIGSISNSVIIAFSGLILIAVGVYYHSRFAYLFGILWGTFIWWLSTNSWPKLFASIPTIKADHITGMKMHDGQGGGNNSGQDASNNYNSVLSILDLLFLIILTLFGLGKALCDLAQIKTIPATSSASSSSSSSTTALTSPVVATTSNEDPSSTSSSSGSIPKGRLLMVIIGVANIISGLLYGPPIILSPECASGIKSGAKTGLCSIVAGFLFILSIFFAPLWTAIPFTATTPVLIMIGMILFQNAKYIDFSSKYGIVAFVCLTLIPFTDSIMSGIGFGYVLYIIISLLNGDTKEMVVKFLRYYFPIEDENDDGEEEEGDEDGGFDDEEQQQQQQQKKKEENEIKSPLEYDNSLLQQQLTANSTFSDKDPEIELRSSASSSSSLRRIKSPPSDRESIGSGGSRYRTRVLSPDNTETIVFDHSVLADGKAVMGIHQDRDDNNHKDHPHPHPLHHHEDDSSFPKITMERARRNTVIFLNQIKDDFDLENEFKSPDFHFH
jgi:AGZA family xanthine/uracil permease-like MFS transporter